MTEEQLQDKAQDLLDQLTYHVKEDHVYAAIGTCTLLTHVLVELTQKGEHE